MSQTYYNTAVSDTVQHPATNKRYRISKRKGVPYITYQRKTRVLFEGMLGFGAYVNVGGERIHFR